MEAALAPPLAFLSSMERSFQICLRVHQNSLHPYGDTKKRFKVLTYGRVFLEDSSGEEVPDL